MPDETPPLLAITLPAPLPYVAGIIRSVHETARQRNEEAKLSYDKSGALCLSIVEKEQVSA